MIGYLSRGCIICATVIEKILIGGAWLGKDTVLPPDVTPTNSAFRYLCIEVAFLLF